MRPGFLMSGKCSMEKCRMAVTSISAFCAQASASRFAVGAIDAICRRSLLTRDHQAAAEARAVFAGQDTPPFPATLCVTPRNQAQTERA